MQTSRPSRDGTEPAPLFGFTGREVLGLLGVALLALLLAMLVIPRAYVFFVSDTARGPSIEELGQFGDTLNIITAFSSLLAFLGLTLTLKHQREELRLQRLQAISDRRFKMIALFMDEHQKIGEEIRTLWNLVLKRAQDIARERGFDPYRAWLGLCVRVMRGKTTLRNGEEEARKEDLLVEFQGLKDPEGPARPDDTHDKSSAGSLKKRLDKAIPEECLDTHHEGRPLNRCRRLVATFWDRLGRLVDDDQFNQGALSLRDALTYFNPGDTLPHILALTILYAQQTENIVPRPDYGTYDLYKVWKGEHRHPDRLFFDTPESFKAFAHWLDEQLTPPPAQCGG